MLQEGFIILIERWLVIPLVGWLVMHQYVNQKDVPQAVQILDQFFGWSLIVVGWIYTHRKPKTQEDAQQENYFKRIYNFIINKVFVSKEIAAVVTDEVQP